MIFDNKNYLDLVFFRNKLRIKNQEKIKMKIEFCIDSSIDIISQY